MSRAKEMVVLGASGFAAEVIEAAELAGWVVTGLYDDDPATHERVVMGRKCIGPISDFERDGQAAYIFAIGHNAVRQKLGSRLDTAGRKAVAVIHPGASVSRTAEVAGGAYIAAGAFVGPHVRVGRHAIVNAGASIGHDAVLGDCSQVCPGARVSGFAVLGEGAFMGSNAVLGPSGVMGEWSKLGACSFANRSVEAHALVVGIPAKRINL